MIWKNRCWKATFIGNSAWNAPTPCDDWTTDVWVALKASTFAVVTYQSVIQYYIWLIISHCKIACFSQAHLGRLWKWASVSRITWEAITKTPRKQCHLRKKGRKNNLDTNRNKFSDYIWNLVKRSTGHQKPGYLLLSVLEAFFLKWLSMSTQSNSSKCSSL